MKSRNQTLKMILKVLQIFDTDYLSAFGLVGNWASLRNRTKPIRLVMICIEGNWVPMLVCDYCGKGPMNNDSDDSCCD